MTNPQVCRVSYRRSRFSTQLPTDRRYTPAHFWLRETEPGLWRVGYTRFASRMLGDLVEYGFEVAPGEEVSVGQTVGWVEAFKATTDVFCAAAGAFTRSNPGLATDPTLFDKDPYGDGWLYEVRGDPDPDTVDAQGYTRLLDAAIDKIQGKDAPHGTAAGSADE